MHQDLDISPEFKLVSREIVALLPKVVLRHDVTLAAVSAELERLASEGVVYAELRCAVTTADQLQELRRAVERSAANGITAKVVFSISEIAAVESAIELARGHRGLVVGVSFEGSAAQGVDKHGDALMGLRRNFLPFVVNADSGEGIAALEAAVTAGAARIAGATQLYEDFSVDLEGIAAGPLSSYIRDREVPLEMSLSADVAAGLVDEVGDHPLPLLQQLGFTCTLNPGGHSVVEEMMVLVEGFDYGLEELFELTVNAMEAAFAPLELRRSIMHSEIIPAYQNFADLEDGAFEDPAGTDLPADEED
ncbi:adenosine deaminase family protein [Corynebacterium sp. H127]|uniref:adenosine deaminase family protein n=1 Tax=Corynebacterium sp. H127 TaxID=3133418 RepID=UPI003094B148